MEVKLYVYRDVVSNSFSPPFASINDDTAKREFDYRLHNDNSMGFRPGDYELYFVGTYNSERGMIDACMPQFIIRGDELF